MLEIKNVTFGYNAHTPLFQNLHVEIQEGKVVGLLGANGSGKTTLFNLLYQMNSYEGVVTWKGEKVEKNQCSYFSSQQYLYSHIKVKEVLSLIQTNAIHLDLNNLIKGFHLPVEEYTHNLSMGTQSKLLLLLNVSLDRELYLFDEPFNGLDFESVEYFYSLITHLQSQGKTIIMSSHIMETLTHNCSEILYLKDGQIKQRFAKEAFSQIRTSIQEHIQKEWET